VIGAHSLTGVTYSQGSDLKSSQTDDEVGMSCLAVPQFLMDALLVPLTYRFRNRMNVCLPCGVNDATESWEAAAAETDCHPDVVYGVTFGHYYTYALIAIGHQHGSTVPRGIRIPYTM